MFEEPQRMFEKNYLGPQEIAQRTGIVYSAEALDLLGKRYETIDRNVLRACRDKGALFISGPPLELKARFLKDHFKCVSPWGPKGEPFYNWEEAAVFMTEGVPPGWYAFDMKGCAADYQIGQARHDDPASKHERGINLALLLWVHEGYRAARGVSFLAHHFLTTDTIDASGRYIAGGDYKDSSKGDPGLSVRPTQPFGTFRKGRQWKVMGTIPEKSKLPG